MVLTNDIPKPPRWMRAREERGKKRKLFAFDINTEHMRELSKLFPNFYFTLTPALSPPGRGFIYIYELNSG